MKSDTEFLHAFYTEAEKLVNMFTKQTKWTNRGDIAPQYVPITHSFVTSQN